MTAAHLVATLGGAGRISPAPGSWGSLVVLPVVLLGPGACLVLGLVLTLAGFWAAPRVIAEVGDDPSWFVADEGAGMLLALAALPAASLPGVLLAFLLFRALDILKPWPISWADAQPGGFGVMLDDVLAGVLSAGAIFALTMLAPGVLG
jgi:phosphatidylglycerophosphatase A